MCGGTKIGDSVHFSADILDDKVVDLVVTTSDNQRGLKTRMGRRTLSSRSGICESRYSHPSLPPQQLATASETLKRISAACRFKVVTLTFR
jgi:hypothetical protein